MLRRFLVGIVACTTIRCAADEGTRPSREDCEAAHAHVAKVVAAEAGRGLAPEELKKHEENLVAAGEPSVQACAAKKSRRHVKCLLDAQTAEAVAACGKID